MHIAFVSHPLSTGIRTEHNMTSWGLPRSTDQRGCCCCFCYVWGFLLPLVWLACLSHSKLMHNASLLHHHFGFHRMISRWWLSRNVCSLDGFLVPSSTRILWISFSENNLHFTNAASVVQQWKKNPPDLLLTDLCSVPTSTTEVQAIHRGIRLSCSYCHQSSILVN